MDIFQTDFELQDSNEVFAETSLPVSNITVVSHDQAAKVAEEQRRPTTKLTSLSLTNQFQSSYSDKFLKNLGRILGVEPDIALKNFKGKGFTLPPNPDIPGSDLIWIKGLLTNIKRKYAKNVNNLKTKPVSRKSKMYKVSDMDLSDIHPSILWFYEFIQDIYPQDKILSVPPNDIFIHLLHVAIQLVEIRPTNPTEVALLNDVRNIPT